MYCLVILMSITNRIYEVFMYFIGRIYEGRANYQGLRGNKCLPRFAWRLTKAKHFQTWLRYI